MTIANVALTDTFDVWRTRHNQLGFLVNAISEGRANTTGSLTISNNLGGASLNVTNGFSTFSGNVMVGSSNTPNARLHVAGSGYVQNTISIGSNYGSSPSMKGYFWANNAGAAAMALVNDSTATGAYSQSYIQTDTGSLIQQLQANVDGGSAYVYSTAFGALNIYTTRNVPLYLGSNNNSQRLTIAVSGNVGIGTTSPTEKLEVSGQIKSSSGLLVGTQNVIPMISGAYSSANNIAGAVATSNNNLVGAFTQANLAIGAVTTANGNITAAFNKANNAIANTAGVGTAGDFIVSGNLSVGTTTTTSYKFQVYGDKNGGLVENIYNVNNGSDACSQLIVQSTNGSLVMQMNAHGAGGGPGYIYYSGNNALSMYTLYNSSLYLGTNNNMQVISITPQYRVGINKNDPGYPFEVAGTIRSSNAIFGTSAQLSVSSDGNILFGGSAALSIYTQTAQKLCMGTNNNDQRLVIGTDGNVGIGNGSPSYPLHVVSSATTPIFATTSVVDAAAVAGGSYLGVYGYLGLSQYGLYSTSDSYVAGNMYYGGSVIHTSDAKLKENVSDLTDCLSILSKIQPRNFTWKKDSNQGKMGKSADIGFIAQEVEKILPNIIESSQTIMPGDKKPETLNDKMTEIKGIASVKLIPYLVGAVKELAAENASLKEEIEKIKTFLKMK